ncbi:764_t:CDS:2, partial [Racocetra persica]
EAKTSIDSYHMQISYIIKRYVHLGFDLTTGEDIEKALGNLSGISTSYLKSNRNQRNQSGIKTIPGISNWFEWS